MYIHPKLIKAQHPTLCTVLGTATAEVRWKKNLQTEIFSLDLQPLD